MNKYCVKCGSEITAGNQFCGNCGAQIIMEQEANIASSNNVVTAEVNIQNNQSAESNSDEAIFTDPLVNPVINPENKEIEEKKEIPIVQEQIPSVVISEPQNQVPIENNVTNLHVEKQTSNIGEIVVILVSLILFIPTFIDLLRFVIPNISFVNYGVFRTIIDKSGLFFIASYIVIIYGKTTCDDNKIIRFIFIMETVLMALRILLIILTFLACVSVLR